MRVDLDSPPQYESLVELLRELHTYYNEGSSVPPEMVRSHLINNLLGPDSPLRLVVAYERIGQVLTNYLSNALKYSPPDQPVLVTLELEDSAARVGVRA